MPHRSTSASALPSGRRVARSRQRLERRLGNTELCHSFFGDFNTRVRPSRCDHRSMTSIARARSWARSTVTIAVLGLLPACIRAVTHLAQPGDSPQQVADSTCTPAVGAGTRRMVHPEDLRVTERVIASAMERSLPPESLLVFVDHLLWIHWLQRSPRGASVVERRGLDLPRHFVACSANSESSAEAFDLGPAMAPDAMLEPRALRILARGWTRDGSDSATTFAEPGITSIRSSGLRDTLRLIESILSARAPRPIALLLFASDESLRRGFPIRWRDHRFTDYSLTNPSLPSVSFIAQRHGALASHELVHLVLTKHRQRARASGDPIPYFAEEALARAIGGSGGVSSRDLIAAQSAADVEVLLRDAIRRDADLAARPFETAEQFGADLDMLGIVLRVGVVRCRDFPAELLSRSSTARVGTAVSRTAAMLRATTDSVVMWAANAAVTHQSVFSEIAAAHVSQQGRVACR